MADYKAEDERDRARTTNWKNKIITKHDESCETDAFAHVDY